MMFEIKWDRASFRYREIERFAVRIDAYMFISSVGVRTLNLPRV